MSKTSGQALVREHKYRLPLFLIFLVALGVNDPDSLDFFWYLVSQANFGVAGYCSQTSKNKEKGKKRK